MTSQWQVQNDESGQSAQTPRSFPARIAAAIVIAAALVLIDGSPQMAHDSQRTGHDRPSACGADAVARAQQQLLHRVPARAGLS